jgi:formylglycine-generating enzyme required for sulfatase activity
VPNLSNKLKLCHIETTAGLHQDRVGYRVTVKFTDAKAQGKANGDLTGELARYGRRWYLLDGTGGGVSAHPVTVRQDEPAGPITSVVRKIQKVLGIGPRPQIHVFAEAGDEAGVKAQISAGVPVKTRDRNGNTALHFAAYAGHAHIVSALLASGAEAKAMNKDGQTPLFLAEARRHSEICSLLGAPERKSNTDDAVKHLGAIQSFLLPGGIELKMAYIPAGTFWMGSPEDEPGSGQAWSGGERHELRHEVTITKEFWIGIYPVTHAQWRAVMGAGYRFPKSANSSPDCPVETLGHNECVGFIKKLNTLQSDAEFRLPTEAEWEYACRAGTEGPRYGALNDIAWYHGNSGGITHPVGQKDPNAWGLYDTFGNVFERCNDLYFSYSTKPFCIDPRPTGQSHYTTMRGGDCRTGVNGILGGVEIENFRAAMRFRGYLEATGEIIGFRLAMTPPASPA